jgi:septal ring factor EnvC (AmiA/AmiB activator)
MELLATLLAFISEKTPEFLSGTLTGLIAGIVLAAVYLLPKLIKSSNEALTNQLALLATEISKQNTHIANLEGQVSLQTQHIANLEEKVSGLESELKAAKKYIENNS